MKAIALKRLGLLGVPKGPGLAPAHKVTLLAELARLGYRITNPSQLDEVAPAFMLDYKHLLQALREHKGGHVAYVPLFKNFPARIPNDGAYFAKRILGYLSNVLHLFEDVVELENGTRVPQWLFDVYDFGADPITQFQSDDLFTLGAQQAQSRQPDRHTEWTELSLVFDDALEAALKHYLKQLVYAKSSIKEALHPELHTLLDFFGARTLDPLQIVFKETKALILKYFWQQEAYEDVAILAQSATDVLRMFAAATGTDVSLSAPIRFPKLTRKARRAVLGVLERSASLEEDLWRYKGLWLELGRYIHPGEYAKQFPRAAAAFDALRNGKIATYAAQTEALLDQRDVPALLRHLGARPGVFARKLHEVLRRFPKATGQVLEAFASKAARLPVKNLLVMKAYFQSINTAAYRTVVNKKGKMKVIPNNALRALQDAQVNQVVDVLDQALHQALAAHEPWQEKRVWIDPALQRYTIPLKQRKASDGVLTVGRGSRLALDASKVIRLFVYWKQNLQRTDLDLSVIQFDADFAYLGHVSYTYLRTDGIVHSGDIQSAPRGATEFIDITLNALAPEVKYLAVQIYRYCGDRFADMTCYAGWMMRDAVDSKTKGFDVKTVTNKFDVNGVGSYALPLVVDIEAHEIMMTDLFVSAKALHNRVEGAYHDVALLCSQLATFVDTQPILADLAEAHVTARQAVRTDNYAEADITFGLTSCTFNATNAEEILSEWI